MSEQYTYKIGVYTLRGKNHKGVARVLASMLRTYLGGIGIKYAKVSIEGEGVAIYVDPIVEILKDFERKSHIGRNIPVSLEIVDAGLYRTQLAEQINRSRELGRQNQQLIKENEGVQAIVRNLQEEVSSLRTTNVELEQQYLELMESYGSLQATVPHDDASPSALESVLKQNEPTPHLMQKGAIAKLFDRIAGYWKYIGKIN